MRISTLNSPGGQERFGRIVAVDPRDREYTARRAMATVPGPIELPKYRYWNCGPALDQGKTSQCVAYSCGQLIEAGPVRQDIYTDKTSAEYLTGLYQRAQQVDEWKGEGYDGTSVRAGMKVLQERSLIRSYQWAWDVSTIAEWVLRVGPVVMGTDWYEHMMQLSPLGARFIWPEGEVLGGHAWLIIGVHTEFKLTGQERPGIFRMINSWGRDWGQNGRAWIGFDAVDKLLKHYGEAAMSTEVRSTAVEEP